MDMSDTIETRYQLAKQASLTQHSPSALIEAIERRELASGLFPAEGLYRAVPTSNYHVVRSADRTQDGRAIFEHAVAITAGSIATVVLIDADYPTSGTVWTDEVSADRVKPEWVSSDANCWVRWTETAKQLLQQLETDVRPVSRATSTLRVERLSKIQAALGLPMQALAQVLGISRPGLYKWFDASKDITLQQASRQRLDVVERLAKLWAERSSAPLVSVAHEPLASGRTVLELLCEQALDEAVVLEAFNEVLAKLQAKPKSLSQRMAEAGFSRRPTRRSIPDDE